MALKQSEVKIIQIVSSLNSGTSKIIGLGDDGKIYEYYRRKDNVANWYEYFTHSE
jgi:hypothetical protein